MINQKKVINENIEEITSKAISYPINTIKTNTQIHNPVPKNLFKGFHYSFFNEVINGLVFYSTVEKLKDKVPNTFIRNTCGSIAAMACSHPLYIRRKLAQVNKPINISNNYAGFGVCVLNGVPGTAINLGLKEVISKRLKLGIFSGFLSTTITTIITHPLDILTTCVLTRTPVKGVFKFNGFGQRLIEKNLTLGTKLMLLDYLNSKNK